MSAVEVLAPGTLTTVQDWPGRVGFWEVGVPPSGPMDERALRIGNRILGNEQGAAGLELTLIGPRLRFAGPATVAITGAALAATLDGAPVPQWQPVAVADGAELALGQVRGAGLRAYVLFAGGLDGPLELGARAAFPAAALGRRALRRGDVLELAGSPLAAPPRCAPTDVPRLTHESTLRVTLGPHGAPDFLTVAGLRELLDASWVVHHHSDRTGIRLIGPSPGWARRDGGEAGLHPSNILDSAYSPGTVMLSGDVAVIVGVDGPSLGGFTAFAQVIRADRWRLGQLRPGDRVRLAAVEAAHAHSLRASFELELAGVTPAAAPLRSERAASVRFDLPLDGAHGPLTFRRAGEGALLVEFGEPRIDLRSRVRAHALRGALDSERLGGVLEVTPGVRSLQVSYDPDELGVARLVEVLRGLERELPDPRLLRIPGRVVHLPLAWRHREAMRAIALYESSVRPDAPWCPDNIEFIRRISGLADEAALRRIVTAASYLVLGLGDVYLGAPVAVPLDPRHRLVTTKYTPARTWTPANAVGIGGAFLCVYGIEGPGGYQLIGRTVQIWNRSESPPWRLAHFDQLRFSLVSEEELEELRAASEAGSWRPASEPTSFSLAEHDRLLERNAVEIKRFTERREAAFARERSAWVASATAAAASVAG